MSRIASASTESSSLTTRRIGWSHCSHGIMPPASSLSRLDGIPFASRAACAMYASASPEKVRMTKWESDGTAPASYGNTRMKDSAKRLADGVIAVALVALCAGGCARKDKGADVAQDSILVKDADLAEHKTDTAGAATAALVKERGATPQPPTLTSGAPVTTTSDVAGSGGRLQPPKRVNPSPVLPSRQSTQTSAPTPPPVRDAVPSSPITPPPVMQPAVPPSSQPAQPIPAQPIPAPKRDSSKRDSISVGL